MWQIQSYYRPGLFRVILIFVMFWNTGFFQALPKLHEAGNELSGFEVAQLTQKVGAFVNSRTMAARTKVSEGGVYSPYDYFADISDIQDYQRELGISCYLNVSRLQDILNKCMDKHGLSVNDLEQARKVYKERLIDKRSGRSEFEAMLKNLGWSGVLLWLFGIYLHNLLPAAIFYFLIMHEKRRENNKRFRFPNPPSFIWVVLAHPYYFAILLKRWLMQSYRERMVEAEYRRSKDLLFVYLSRKEQRKIKEVAAGSMPLQDWRKFLIFNGLKPIHSLAVVLCVMVLIAILPKPSEAKTQQTSRCGICAIDIEEIYQHLARMDIDDEHDYCSSEPLPFIDQPFPAVDSDERYFPLMVWAVLSPLIFSFQEVFIKIVHVPLTALFRPVTIRNFSYGF